MKRTIELRKINGDLITINTDKIRHFSKTDTGSIIFFDNEDYESVKESYQELRFLIVGEYE